MQKKNTLSFFHFFCEALFWLAALTSFERRGNRESRDWLANGQAYERSVQFIVRQLSQLRLHKYTHGATKILPRKKKEKRERFCFFSHAGIIQYTRLLGSK